MRKATIGLLTMLMLLLAVEAQAQDAVLMIWGRGGNSCPMPTLKFSFPPVPLILSDINPNNGATCTLDPNIQASGWSTDPTVDTVNGPYFSYSFTPLAPTTIEFNGTEDKADVNGIVRNADGPQTGQLYYRYDGGAIIPAGPPFPITTTPVFHELIFPTLTVHPGETLELRLYAWNATDGSGTIEMNSFDIDGQDVLPVELTSFDALVDGEAVMLQWETASEINNAGFFIEMALEDPFATDEDELDDLDYRQLGFVEGNGNTELAQSYTYRIEALDPGRYAFRLKQIDFDGTFEYHPVVEALVEVPTTHFLSAAYPNPFNPQAQFRLSVAQRQYIKVDLYNALGQMVDVLYEGPMDANVTRTFTIDGSTLPSGLYLYRATGESFTESRPVLLVK